MVRSYDCAVINTLASKPRLTTLRLAFNILDVEKMMEHCKKFTSEPPPSSPQPGWFKRLVLPNLVAGAGLVGSIIAGRGSPATSPQQAPLQISTAGQSIAAVATAAATAAVKNVVAGGAGQIATDNDLVANYMRIALDRRAMPFFRTYPSHLLSYTAGAVSGWSASEYTLHNAGRLIFSVCPRANESAHLQTLERLHSCMTTQMASETKYASLNTTYNNYESTLELRNKRIEYLTLEKAAVEDTLSVAKTNVSVLTTRLEGLNDRYKIIDDSSRECKASLNECNTNLHRAMVRVDKLCPPASTTVNPYDMVLHDASGTTHANPPIRQSRTTNEDVFFIKGSCPLGVTTTFIESGPPYQGRATCRTVADVGSYTTLCIAATVGLNLVYNSYLWYTKASINAITSIETIKSLTAHNEMLAAQTGQPTLAVARATNAAVNGGNAVRSTVHWI